MRFGIWASGLERLRVRDPRFEIRVIVAEIIGGDHLAAADVSEVGRDTAAGKCSADSVAHGAGAVKKICWPRFASGVVGSAPGFAAASSQALYSSGH